MHHKQAELSTSTGSPAGDDRRTPPNPTPPVDRMTLRLDEVAAALGVDRRTLERLRSAGKFVAPDLKIGRMPLWSPETIRRWVQGGGAR